MKLWLISQRVNNGWDSYDSAVVAALDEEVARRTYPGGADLVFDPRYRDWAAPEHVAARLIGEAVEGTEAGVICASFNAG